MTDSGIEKAAGLPPAFLTKSRAGKNRNPKAIASWGKLRAWLASQGKTVARGLAVDPPKAAPSDSDLSSTTFEALAKEIGEIGTSAKKHRQAYQNLAIALIRDPEFDAKRAELTLQTMKALGASIKLEKIEAAQEKMGELRIMTLDQEAEYLAWAATKAAQPLAPGERAQAPKSAPP